MFSKIVKSSSLVSKLMWLYSLSTIAILAAICLFLYPTFVKMTQQIHGNAASHITAECYEKIIITLLLSSLSAIILGYMIARNGLRRMREFENKMEQITADSLHERISPNEWPKELKSLGKKFNTMLDRIQTSFNQLTQFSSDIAHELRTPLNNLRGITELALTKENLPDKYRHILEGYMNEYQQLSKLIENLLFLARSDHGQLKLNKTEIHAAKEISVISEYYQALAEENEVELSCKGDATLSADPILFRRIISNLLSNALRHTPRTGKITTEINALDTELIQIAIHDTGTGIADEHQEKIFDRFYRADFARSTQSGGLGLGLAIVKSIVELHHGTITLQSKLNHGTSIYLQLPR